MAIENRNHTMVDMQESFETLLQSICGPKFYADAKKFAVQHPFIFTAVFCICLFSFVPMLFFLGFAVISLFIALLCFLCIEGSIIAIGGIIFIAVVGFISVIVVAILSAVAAAYWILQQFRTLLYINLRDRTAIVEEKSD